MRGCVGVRRSPFVLLFTPLCVLGFTGGAGAWGASIVDLPTPLCIVCLDSPPHCHARRPRNDGRWSSWTSWSGSWRGSAGPCSGNGRTPSSSARRRSCKATTAAAADDVRRGGGVRMNGLCVPWGDRGRGRATNEAAAYHVCGRGLLASEVFEGMRHKKGGGGT